MAAAPPAAIPAISPVKSTGEELAVGVEVVVLLEEGVMVEAVVGVMVEAVVGMMVEAVVDTARVGVRTALLAVRVKYTGRSRFAHVAGAVTVAAPTEL